MDRGKFMSFQSCITIPGVSASLLSSFLRKVYKLANQRSITDVSTSSRGV